MTYVRFDVLIESLGSLNNDEGDEFRWYLQICLVHLSVSELSQA